jgi:integrase
MAIRLTDGMVKDLPTPESGNRVHYDTDVKGFGCRVTANGVRAFVLNYRTRSGRERRYTIGQFPAWKVKAARLEAAEWQRRIDRGEDPLEALEMERAAPTVADMCKRYRDDELPKKREATQRDYASMIDRDILPAFKHRKVADIIYSDIDDLHRKIGVKGRMQKDEKTGKDRWHGPAPYRANRVVALLSKMFGLSIRWGWRSDNPAKGIERNQEVKRHRYLSTDELSRLTVALAAHEDQQAANIVRLLLLTGARSDEVRGARWEQFDLSAGVWTKPGATTKQKTDHRVPLSAPARQLLSEIHAEAEKVAAKKGKPVSDYVFPGRSGGYRDQIKNAWASLCKAAAIEGARIHDLRHTYASMLASANISLPTIGALLGHTQPQTTARYAHLFDDPLRAATERVGAIIDKPRSGEVVAIKERLAR